MAHRRNPAKSRGVKCRRCGADEWHWKTDGRKNAGGSWVCRPCVNKRRTHRREKNRAQINETKRRWYRRHLERRYKWALANPVRRTAGALKSHATRRSRIHGLECSITTDCVEQMLIRQPRCPVFGTVFPVGPHGRGLVPESPSLDRLDPNKGYVVGNVALISHRANSMKRDATLAELEKLVAWMRTRGLK